MPGLGDAPRAGVRGYVARRVDEGQLAHVAPLVLRQQGGQRLGSGTPFLEQRQAARPSPETLTKDWVAIAPTPASAQGQSEPTENQCDCTATPISPVSGSRATIE